MVTSKRANMTGEQQKLAAMRLMHNVEKIDTSWIDINVVVDMEVRSKETLLSKRSYMDSIATEGERKFGTGTSFPMNSLEKTNTLTKTTGSINTDEKFLSKGDDSSDQT